jgi:hypothetical protein
MPEISEPRCWWEKSFDERFRIAPSFNKYWVDLMILPDDYNRTGATHRDSPASPCLTPTYAVHVPIYPLHIPQLIRRLREARELQGKQMLEAHQASLGLFQFLEPEDRG